MFDEICTTPHVKRAAEVAIAGGHTIWFIGAHESAKREMAELVYNYGCNPRDQHEDWVGTGSRGYDAAPCVCGYYRDPKIACTCSAEQINRWRLEHYPVVMPPMAVYVPRPEVQEIVRWLQTGQSGEPHDTIMDRIQRAIERVEPDAVDELAWQLMEQFIKTKHISPRQAKQSLAVARTVGRLAGANAVEAVHMAEALQYRIDKYV